MVENYLINVYNKNNPNEYANLEKAIKTATTQYKLEKTIREYESKICDTIAQNIYDIAKKSNSNIDFEKELPNYLSGYGYNKSQEFFAECFANMLSGKPNKLGLAMKKYLSEVL